MCVGGERGGGEGREREKRQRQRWGETEKERDRQLWGVNERERQCGGMEKQKIYIHQMLSFKLTSKGLNFKIINSQTHLTTSVLSPRKNLKEGKTSVVLLLLLVVPEDKT